MGYAKYVGRVGALAVVLGVGAAVSGTTGTAWAEPTGSGTSSPAADSPTGDTIGSDTRTEGTTPDPGPTQIPGSGSGTVDGGTPTGTEPAVDPTTPSGTTTVVAPGVTVSSSGGAHTSGDDATTKQTRTAKPKSKATSTSATTATPAPAARVASSGGATTSGSTSRITTAVAATPTAALPAPRVVTATSVPSTPVVSASMSPVAQLVAAPATIIGSVLSAFSTALLGTGPGGPAESPAPWMMLAAARREFGQNTATKSVAAPAALTSTGQPLRAAAATAPNLPPTVADDPAIDAVDPTTGTVTGHVVATDTTKLTYTLTSSPSTGKFTLNKTTGAFSYTPTATQRVLAQLSPGVDTVSFSVTVSDGVAANNQSRQLAITVSPTTIADVGEVATGAGTSAVATTNTRAYVTNTDAKTVTVIDTINRVKLADIALTVAPTGVAVTPDGKKVYIVDDTTNLITVVDAATNLVGTPIDFGANREPVLLTISPDGKTLYATGVLTDAKTGVDTAVVTKVSTTTNKITGTVKLAGALTDVFYDTVVAPDGKKIYVITDIPPVVPDPENPDFVDSGLYVFSSTSSTAKLIYTGGYFSAVAVSPDSTKVYLADNPNGEVTVFDAKSTNQLGTINVGGNPVDLVLNKDGSLLLVFDDTANTIKVFDTTSSDYDLVTTVATNADFEDWYPAGVLSPDGMELYFNSEGALQILSLVPTNAKPVAGVATPSAPNTTTGSVAGGLGVTDPDLDKLTYAVTGAPSKGKVVLNPDGTFTYTPTAAARHNASADGATTALTDTFTVTVTDGRRGIVTQLVTITIAPTNTPPTTKTSAPNPSSSTGVVKGSVTGTDKDKDPLSYTVATGPTKGVVTIDAKGKFTYTPDADARHDAAATGATPADKVDTFTVTVDDGHGGTTDKLVTVKISPKNAKPTAAAATVNPPATDTGLVTGTLTATDTDLDAFTYRTTTLKKGTIFFGSNGQFTYLPTQAARQAATAPKASTATKTEKFTVTVDDGHGGTTTTTVTVAIAPIPVGPPNNTPVGGAATVNPPDPTTSVVTGTVTATDPDADPLSYAGPTGGTTPKGTVSVNATTGAFTYTPTAAARHSAAATGASAAVKADTFTITVADGKGGTLPVTVSVTIVGKNAAPTGNYAAGQPNSATGVVAGTVTSTDPDGDTRTYSAPTTSTKGGTVTVNATTGAFTYTPNPAARHAATATGATAADKTDTFDLTVADTFGGSTTVAVSVTVLGKNVNPVAGAPTVGTPNASSGVVTGSVTATDGDGDALGYATPATTTKGAVTINATTGAFSYTPTEASRQAAAATNAPAAAKTDSFTVTITDAHGGSTTSLVNVTVAPAEATNPVQGVDGIPLGNVVVGSTGNVYQVIGQYDFGDGTTQPTFTSFVRVYSAAGAVIGDTATLNGVPVAAPVVRSDGGVAIVSYNQAAFQTTVMVVGTNAGTTSSTFRGAPGGTGAGAEILLGTEGVKYVVTSYFDQGSGHVLVVPLSAGSVAVTEVQGIPVVGQDGTLYALLSSGTPEAPQRSVLRIKPNGTISYLTPSALAASDPYSGISAVSGGPDGTGYVTTIVRNPKTGQYTSEVLVFGPSSSTATRTVQVPESAMGGVLVGANGTAYQLSQTDFSSDDVIITKVSGGVASSTSVPVGFFGYTVVGVSDNGTLYLTSPDSDNDVTNLIIGRPDGTTSVVQLGDFEFESDITIGADNNAYWHGRDVNNNPASAAITPAGAKHVIPGGGIVALGSDGTAYVAVDGSAADGSDGVVVLISTDGFATYHTSDAVTGQTVPFETHPVQGGPNGTAYVQTDDPNILLTALDGNGDVVATVPGGGTVIGPVAFGGNGTGYVAVQTGQGANSKTAVWVLTASGATKLAEFDGQPATTANSASISNPAVVIAPNGKLYLTTVVIDYANQTYVTYVNVVSTTPVI